MKKLYLKLAGTNIIKNKKTYLPYIITCIGTIIIYYLVQSIAICSSLDGMRGGKDVKELFKYTSYLMIGISAILLYYTNSFLMKNRSKEIGLYNILGMQKKHIGIILFFESAITYIFSLVSGVLLGMVLSKGMFALLLNLLKSEIKFADTFTFSVPAIIKTAEVFGIIMLVILVRNIIYLKANKPVELLKGAEKGEKEPKANKIIAVLSIAVLAAGYIKALSLTDPIKAIMGFFMAVVLVIIGTYGVFISASIFILKILKKNKKIYYKSKNFITISGMLYRMKQNAAGLATICILSTCVLATMTSTVSLYAGIEDALKSQFPFDATISLGDNGMEFSATEEGKEKKAQLVEKINNIIKGSEDSTAGVTVKDITQEDTVIYEFERDNSSLTCPNLEDSDSLNVSMLSKIAVVTVMTQDQFNKIEGTDKQLGDDEIILLTSEKNKLGYNTISIENKEFKVKEELLESKTTIKADLGGMSAWTVIVKNDDVIKELNKNIPSDLAGNSYTVYFNMEGEKEAQKEFINKVKQSTQQIMQDDSSITIINSDIITETEETYTLNGSFIFIGSFLGILFLLGTILIIYYKQISEGYADKNRFEILKKVGMSRKEIKKVINKQVIVVFFLPLLASILHIAAAFGPISKMLVLFGLMNSQIFVIATIITVLIFAAVYMFVYSLTAKTYYNIVSE